MYGGAKRSFEISGLILTFAISTGTVDSLSSMSCFSLRPLSRYSPPHVGLSLQPDLSRPEQAVGNDDHLSTFSAIILRCLW